WSSRWRRRRRYARAVGVGSWFPLFVFIEELPQFVDFLFRRLAGRERSDHEVLHRPVEPALKQIAGQLLLHLLARLSRFVHMRALALVTVEQALVRHDLHEL